MIENGDNHFFQVSFLVSKKSEWTPVSFWKKCGISCSEDGKGWNEQYDQFKSM